MPANAAPEPVENLLRHDLIAAFTLRFASYTQWPESAFAFPTSPVCIWVPESENLNPSSYLQLESLSVRGRPIRVLFYEDLVEEPAHVVITFGDHKTPNSRSARNLPLPRALIINARLEPPMNRPESTMLRLFPLQGRMAFDACIPKSKTSQIKLSSRMLQLAHRVFEP